MEHFILLPRENPGPWQLPLSWESRGWNPLSRALGGRVLWGGHQTSKGTACPTFLQLSQLRAGSLGSFLFFQLVLVVWFFLVFLGKTALFELEIIFPREKQLFQV